MQAENFSLSRWFDRIGMVPPARFDAAALAEAMRRQLFTVPFENLDVQMGREISLDPQAIVDKILNRGRGGYCYEVNGLFALALTALGVAHRFVAARPMFYPVRRPRTHMAIVATLDGVDWLCDLGFGSWGIRAPMRLDRLDEVVEVDGERFRLRREADDVYVVSALVEGGWADQYGFDLSPQEWIDFAPANYLNSHHPDAIFVQKSVVVRLNERGRTLLVGDTLKRSVDGRIETRTIAPDERDAILAQEFGLVVEGLRRTGGSAAS